MTLAPLGIYIHWPFCPQICPYCDFNVYKQRDVDVDNWERAIALESERVQQMVPERELVSIYFGGGTPSLMLPRLVEAIIRRLTDLWPACTDLEITLESNSTYTEAQKFAAFKTVGVNRLSLGVQSLSDRSLSFLGRWHSGAEAERAVEVAKQTFDNVSVDLIYALPGQSVADWRKELGRILAQGPDHLSLYQLTIEQGTAFQKAVARGDWAPVESDMAAAFYETSQELCEQAQLPAYEVSNHAAVGKRSRHNSLYWRYQEYAGIGPGAHGRLRTKAGITATLGHRRPEEWLKASLSSRGGWDAREVLTPEEEATERLIMGLRLDEGVPEAWILDQAAVGQLEQEGLLERKGGHVVPTMKGRLVLDRLALQLCSG